MNRERLRRTLSVTFLTAGLIAGATLISSALGATDGSWQTVSDWTCPRNQVCADWFVNGQPTGDACCIRENDLGTSNPDACTGAEPVRDRTEEEW